MKKTVITTLLALVIMLVPSMQMSMASDAVTTTCDAYQGRNVEYQNYSRWSSTIKSYLVPRSDGKLMRIQSGAVSEKIVIEYFDSSYNFLSSKTLSTELPIFGGFYETSSNYYVLSGQNNPNENNSLEVYRITKYDKSWNKIASCGLFGANTYIPFDAGSARMTDNGKYLLIRTCHEMYQSSDGLHHQANVTIQVDMDAMQITDSLYSVSSSTRGYVSHSFNQFIKTDGNKIVAVDHGDAYPRSIALLKYSGDFTTGKFNSGCSVNNLLSFPGATGENATGASVGGFEVSDTSYIVAGNYTGDANYSSSTATRNIFISVLGKNATTPTYKQITNYTSGSASTPHLVKIADNSYMLMWSYSGKVYYTKLDGNGNTVGSTYSMTGSLSDCVPTVYNGKLVWYTWQDEVVTFYSINLSSISSNSQTVLNTGHDFTTVNTSGSNVATQTCTKCGHTQTITVPTSFSMWWRKNADSGSYWSSYPTEYHIGDTLDVWVTISGSVDNSQMVFEISDSSLATLDTTGYSTMRRITMKDNGTFTLKVYPRYNTAIAKTYSFTIKHDFTSKVVAPTCTAKGYTLYTCSTCGHTEKTDETAMLPHTLGTPTWTWNGFTSATATSTCSKCSTKVNFSGAITSSVTKAATCAATGTRTYTANVTISGKSYSNTNAKTETIPIDPNAHSWNTTSTYTWSSDYKTCTAKRTCKNDSSHVQTETVNSTSAVKTNPTCTVKGTTTYTAAFKNTAFAKQTKDVQNIAAIGHSWNATTYTWSSDYKTCTAKRTCKNDSTHVQTETVNSTSAVKIKATCTEKGTTTYTAAFTNTAFAKQTKDVQNIAALGHSWSAWTTTKAATCTTDGTKTRTCSTCKKSETQTITKLGHSWNAVTYTWSSDNKTCTAKRTCKNNSAHVETQTVNSTSTVKTQPTCTVKGTTTYTATFTNSAFAKQTKNVQNIAATGHKWGGWINSGFDIAKGTRQQTRTCSVCKTKETKSIAGAVTRLAGGNRYGTAGEISKKMYTTQKTTTVVLANGLVAADALAGVPLATKLNAPILLTTTDKVPDETMAEIKRLGAKKVVILGGTGAISEKVEKTLKDNGLTIERLAGKTRFETAAKIADKLQTETKKAPTEAFFVYYNSYADALSASTVAAIKEAPIFYVTTDGKLDDATKAQLDKIKSSITKAYVIGGEGVISDNMKKNIRAALGNKTVERVSGGNRYSTCVEVNNKFKSVLTGKAICVAKGLDFPDALAGGVFAAQNKAPLFLADNKLQDVQTEYLKSKKADSIYIFGGTGAVSDELAQSIGNSSY